MKPNWIECILPVFLLWFTCLQRSIEGIPPDCAPSQDPLRLIAFRHNADRNKILGLSKSEGSCVTLEAECAQLLYCLDEHADYFCMSINPYRTTSVCHRLKTCLVSLCSRQKSTVKKQLFVRITANHKDHDHDDGYDLKTNEKTMLRLFRTDSVLPWAMICYITLIISIVVVFFVILAFVLVYCTSCGTRWRQRLRENHVDREHTARYTEQQSYIPPSTADQVCISDSASWITPPSNQPKPPSYHSVIHQPAVPDYSNK
ncbi:unnamed protein product [Echinostoma caproni]|uniref:GDNF domain-containing protein n=1 Tax=Echinostoma caproni TaxID=27848 RepID=A0A183A6K0_9TREM|nr:unnamed protein product [Echinostoma caproni]